jgi:hypothetical protein
MLRVNKWKDRSVKFKAEVVWYSYTHTINETSEKYDVPRSTVSRWRERELRRIKSYMRSKAA